MLRTALCLAKSAGVLSRALGRGGGTTVPGRVLTALDRNAVARLGGQLEAGSIVISATNGKTTTANMVAAILRNKGLEFVHNRAGANLVSGVASALTDAATVGGRISRGTLGLFEVDEAAMPAVARELRPKVLVLANLFRDQLDRYGELEHIANLWREIVREQGPETTVVLNADDPLVASLAPQNAGGGPAFVHFGLDDPHQALPALQHAADSKYCPRCGQAFAYDSVYLGHLGDYRCPGCALARPPLDLAVQSVETHGMRGSRVTVAAPAGTFELKIPLPGLYNVYNALAATACCLALGASADEVKRGIEAFSASFGRAETIAVDGRELSILLIKNPTGTNEVLRAVSAEHDAPLDLLVALNDKIADGRDVSWVWDADFEVLAGRVRTVVCSGTRAGEMAVRLKYAGIPGSRLHVESDLGRALDAALTRSSHGPVYALPTYTALLALRRLLAKRGHAAQFWEERAGDTAG